MTAVPKRLLKALDARDGHRCAWHWGGACDTATLVPHHRQNRGMGGSPSGMVLSQLVWLCAGLNGALESDAHLARVARHRGIKVPRNGFFRAADVPVRHAVHGWVLLSDDGTVVPVLESVALELMSVYGLNGEGEP